MFTRKRTPQDVQDPPFDLAVYQNAAEWQRMGSIIGHHCANVFKDAFVIQFMEVIPEMVRLSMAEPKNFQLIGAMLQGLLQHEIVDAMRICYYFENYQKFALISKGYMVHYVKKASVDQREQPILVQDVVSNGSVISDQTIGMKPLMTPAYRKVIGMPDRLADMVEAISVERNKLHFHSDRSSQWSMEVYNDLKYMKDFVDGDPWAGIGIRITT